MNATAVMAEPNMDDVLNERSRLVIPTDLRQWVSPAQLREWIFTDVAQLHWTAPEVMELLRRHPDFEPKALLNTMTFAYAVGIHSADEIARRCSSDPDFRGVRPKLPPDATDFKRFRKENLVLLKWGLVNLLTRVVKSRFVEGESLQSLPPGLQRYVIENAVERLEIARHMDRISDLV